MSQPVRSFVDRYAWLIGPGVLLASALLIGRVSGLVREIVVAAKFGITADGDRAVLLLALPDMMVGLLVSGGISAALVPKLSKLDANEGAVFLRFTLWLVLLLFGAIGLLIAFWPTSIFTLLAPGSPDLGRGTAAWVAAMIGACLPLAAVTGVIGGALNANGRYLWVGLGTFVFNVTFIGAFLLGAMTVRPLEALAIGVFAATAVRLGTQLISLRHSLFTGRVLPEAWRSYVVDFASGLFATAMMVLAPIIIRSAASYYDAGTVAAVNFAQKLVELPVGVVLSSISTIALTQISMAFARDGYAGALDCLVRHARTALLLGIICGGTGFVFSEQVSAMIFGYGNVTAMDLDRITENFAIGALAIPITGLCLIYANYFYAVGRSNHALYATAISLLALILFLLCFNSRLNSINILLSHIFQQSLVIFVFFLYLPSSIFRVFDKITVVLVIISLLPIFFSYYFLQYINSLHLNFQIAIGCLTFALAAIPAAISINIRRTDTAR
jgi:putative peptidoglycan lipid II flippase